MYFNYEVIINGITFQVAEKEQVFKELIKDSSKIKYFKKDLNFITDLSSFERRCNTASAVVVKTKTTDAVIKSIKGLFDEKKTHVRSLLKSKYITVAFSEWVSPLTQKRIVFTYFYAMKKPFIENRNAFMESHI